MAGLVASGLGAPGRGRALARGVAREPEGGQGRCIEAGHRLHRGEAGMVVGRQESSHTLHVQQLVYVLYQKVYKLRLTE